MSTRLREESEKSIGKIKALSEQVHKNDVRGQQMQDQVQALERENGVLREQVQRYKQEAMQKEQQANSY